MANIASIKSHLKPFSFKHFAFLLILKTGKYLSLDRGIDKLL